MRSKIRRYEDNWWENNRIQIPNAAAIWRGTSRKAHCLLVQHLCKEKLQRGSGWSLKKFLNLIRYPAPLLFHRFVTQWVTESWPIDRTPGTPGSDKSAISDGKPQEDKSQARFCHHRRSCRVPLLTSNIDQRNSEERKQPCVTDITCHGWTVVSKHCIHFKKEQIHIGHRLEEIKILDQPNLG